MTDPSSAQQQWELFPKELSSYRDGRDELNLAEFPITMVGSRSDPLIKTLVFEDDAIDKDTRETIHRKLTVAASDKYGLPTAADDEVLLGLLQISRFQNFRSSLVAFTPYQLLKILGWRTSTGNYRRLRESIERWLGVTLHYQNAWKDKKNNHWIDASFHFIEFAEFHRPGEHSSSLVPEGLSVIRWNDLVLMNMREGNLKTLDFYLYTQLKSSIAKRMFRFLDKRFGLGKKKFTFELETFACEKIGLTRPVKISATGRSTTDVGQIKRRLLAAIRELEAARFILPLPLERRFTKNAVGRWHVLFEHGLIKEPSAASEAQPALALDVTEVSPLEGRLTGHGVTLPQARRLVAEHPPERVEIQLEALEYLLARGKENHSPVENRAGWLVKAVTENYGPPRGFKPRAQRDVEAKEKSLKAQQRKETLRQSERAKEQTAARTQERDRQVNEYLAGLTQAQREELEVAAIEAGEFKGRLSAAMRRMCVRSHVIRRLWPDQGT